MFATPKAASGLILCQDRSKSGSCGLYDSLYKIAISSCGLTPAAAACSTTCGAYRRGFCLSAESRPDPPAAPAAPDGVGWDDCAEPGASPLRVVAHVVTSAATV